MQQPGGLLLAAGLTAAIPWFLCATIVYVEQNR